MKNIAKFNYPEIKVIFTNNKLINVNLLWTAIGVSTDTRTLEKDNIFVAILGEKFDGHNSLEEAFSRGASAAVISDSWFADNKETALSFDAPLIVVNNTIEALGKLANFHRKRFHYPIIAVCGSNGKTTTKELIASVLGIKYNVLKTYKNYNNRIGVPLMLLQLSDTYQVAILELGTSIQDEIKTLTEMVDPTDGLITNIGFEHLEMLINLDGVEIEETSLFNYLDKKGRRCFINKNDERLAKYENIVSKPLTYGIGEGADYTINVEFDLCLNPILFLTDNILEKPTMAHLNSTGLALAYNAVAAAAVGYGFGLNTLEIAKGLSNFTPDTSNIYARMVVYNHKHLYILNDCYNANSSSMEVALQTLHMFKLGLFKIAVLGDMGEMGINSHQEHIKTIKYALELIDEVIVIGQNMQKAAYEIIMADNSANLRIFNNYYEIATYFRMLDIKSIKTVSVLIKGSRFMAMENLIQMLKSI